MENSQSPCPTTLPKVPEERGASSLTIKLISNHIRSTDVPPGSYCKVNVGSLSSNSSEIIPQTPRGLENPNVPSKIRVEGNHAPDPRMLQKGEWVEGVANDCQGNCCNPREHPNANKRTCHAKLVPVYLSLTPASVGITAWWRLSSIWSAAPSSRPALHK